MRFLRIVDRFCIRVGWRRWAGVALAAPIGIFLIGRSLSVLPFAFYGDVLYPCWIFRGDLVVLLAGVWLLSVAFMLRAAWSVPAKEEMGAALAILLVVSMALCGMALCGISVIVPDFIRYFAPSHISSIQFNTRTYHLARYFGSGSDMEETLAVYMVYQCDSSGITCHLYYCPLFQGTVGSEYVEYARDLKAFFEIDPAGRLWVQVGPEKTEVKPGCTYGTGYDPPR